VRLYPRLAHAATLLVPFPDLPAVMRAVPAVVRSGVDPNILEYVDKLTLAAISYAQNLNLGIPDNNQIMQRAGDLDVFQVELVEDRCCHRLLHLPLDLPLHVSDFSAEGSSALFSSACRRGVPSFRPTVFGQPAR